MNTFSTIQLAYLQTMFENDQDMIVEMLTACLLQCELMKSVIKRSFDDRDVATLSRVAHQMKPTMHYLGVDSVYEQLRSVEPDSADQYMQYIGMQTSYSLANIIVDLKLALQQYAKTSLFNA